MAAEAATGAGSPVEHRRPADGKDILLRSVDGEGITERRVVLPDRLELEFGSDLLQLLVRVESDGHHDIGSTVEGGWTEGLLRDGKGGATRPERLGLDGGSTVVAHAVHVHVDRSLGGLGRFGRQRLGTFDLGGRGGVGAVAVVSVSALVLLHVVFPGKGLVANRTADIFLASVLLAMACGMPRSREGVGAAVFLCVGARVLLLRGLGSILVLRRRGWCDSGCRRGQLERRCGYQVGCVGCKLDRWLKRKVRVVQGKGRGGVERWKQAGRLRCAWERLLGRGEVGPSSSRVTEVRVV